MNAKPNSQAQNQILYEQNIEKIFVIMTSFMTSSKSVFVFKMTTSTEHHREIIKLYYESNSVVIVVNNMQKLHPEEEKLNRVHVRRIVRRFEQTADII